MNPNDTSNSTLAVIEENQMAVIPPSSLEVIQRAEIDVQITTARKYPRSLARFKTTSVGMATMDEDTAASCIYSRPVGGGKNAEGLSVRMAEIVAASYGNLRFGSTIIEQNERQVTVRGFCHDLENNVMAAVEVIELTVKKPRPGQTVGDPYDERMRAVIAKSALSKAIRDAIFRVVPKALARPAEIAAKAVMAGDAQTMAAKRASLATWVRSLGIDEKRFFAAQGIGGYADVTIEMLIAVTGMKTAIADGDLSIDEAFPPIVKAGTVGQATPAAGSVTEAAEKEKVAEGAKPVTPPADDNAPDAKTLFASLMKKAGEMGAGKVRLKAILVEQKQMKEEEKLEDLDAKRLAGILEGWEIIKASTTAK